MIFSKTYPFLKQNKFSKDEYSIVPIRYEDRLKIMQWRNEQIYHLRQSEPLTEKKQEAYFTNVVAKLFEQNKPSQILFSYLRNDECIGYGGLVHINWIDKNAEISFIINTELEKNEFQFHWKTYLELLEKIAFKELKLHKIYTYAFDLRPHLYKAVESAGFIKEATLREHCIFQGEAKNVIIHSKINRKITVRIVTEKDTKLIFKWANDKVTRQNSFQSKEIVFEEHKSWFLKKLQNPKASYYICEVNNKEAGLVRFDKEENSTTIGITLAANFRGQKLATTFLKKCCKTYRNVNSDTIYAYIKKENIASVKSFIKAGFVLKEETLISNIPTYVYIYEK